MYQIEKKENDKNLYEEYMAFNKLVGTCLLVENNTPQQAADLKYFDRKLKEAKEKLVRARLRKNKGVK